MTRATGKWICSHVSRIDFKAAKAQKPAKGGIDRFPAQVVEMAQNPLSLQNDGLAEPESLRSHHPGRDLGLLGIISGHHPDDDAGIERDQRLSRAASAIAAFISSTV